MSRELLGILPFLCCPDNGSDLRYVDAHEVLESAEKQNRYAVKNGIPQMLLAAAPAVTLQSKIHHDFKTGFDYVDHYRKDAEVFDYFIEHADGASRHESNRLHETILSTIPKTIKTILDVGCGKAWIAEAMKDRDVEVVSMDISFKNVNGALAKYPFKKHYGLVADLFALPLKANSFDCIVCSEVIEHVPNPMLLIQELIKRLSPNGVLLLTTPHNEKIIYHLCVHCNKPTPHDAHLHSFTKASLTEMAQMASEGLGHLKTVTFSNRYLTRLRFHYLLQYFPFGVWRMVDRLANSVLGKPVRLLLVFRKAD